MPQRDYIDSVYRTRNKKYKSNIKTITIILLFVFITLVSNINFLIVHTKSDKLVMVPIVKKHTSNELPPKPKERWRYISELEK